jgi:hypothetical protein
MQNRRLIFKPVVLYEVVLYQLKKARTQIMMIVSLPIISIKGLLLEYISSYSNDLSISILKRFRKHRLRKYFLQIKKRQKEKNMKSTRIREGYFVIE